MRTKQLLWTMALPALFAACTSDDVFEAQSEVSALAGRPVVGNVQFVTDGADIRIGIDNATYSWSEGDAYGVCLIDNYVPNSSAKKAQDNYQITDAGIQTNYKWACTDPAKGVFAGDAALVEGNYLLYAPYQESNYSRQPLQLVTPSQQTLEIKEDGTPDEWSPVRNAIAEGKTPFFMQYVFLENGTLGEGKADVNTGDMLPIFATPKITLTNAKSTPVEITKIAVQTANDFPVKAEIDNERVVKAMNKVDGLTVGDKDNGVWNQSKAQANNWIGTSTYDLIEQYASTTAKSNIIVINIKDDQKLTIPTGESREIYAVLPGVQTGILTIYAYTGTDAGYTTYSDKTYAALTLIPGKRYSKQDYDYTGSVRNTAGKIMTGSISGNPATISAGAIPVVVSSQEEFVKAIEDNNGSLTIIPTVDIYIDKKVQEKMAEVKNQELTIRGTVEFRGPASGDALQITERITVTEKATVTGNVTLGTGSKVKITINNTESTYYQSNIVLWNGATIAEKANVTLGAINSIYWYDANGGENEKVWIENNGTLLSTTTPVKVLNGETGTVTKTDLIEIANGSKGNITISSGTLTGTLAGNYTVTGTVTCDENCTLPDGLTLTVASTGKLKGALRVEGGATLNVNGTLDANVEMAGTYKDDDYGYQIPDKTATVNLAKTSTIIGNIEGKSSGSYYYNSANVINVYTGANFFNEEAITLDHVTSKVSVGTVTSSTKLDEVLVKNVNCIYADKLSSTESKEKGNFFFPAFMWDGYLCINGDLTVNSTQYTDLYGTNIYVDGNVYTSTALGFGGTEDDSKLENVTVQVAGDWTDNSKNDNGNCAIYWNGTSTQGASELYLDGDWTIENQMMNEKLKEVYVGGQILAKKSIGFNGATTVTLGGDVTVGASDGAFDLKTCTVLNIYNNVELKAKNVDLSALPYVACWDGATVTITSTTTALTSGLTTGLPWYGYLTSTGNSDSRSGYACYVQTDTAG